MRIYNERERESSHLEMIYTSECAYQSTSMRFKKGEMLRFYHAHSFIPGTHGTDIRISCDTQLSYSHKPRSIFEIEQFDAFESSSVFSPSQLTGEQTEVECLHKFVMSPTLRAFCASKHAARG